MFTPTEATRKPPTHHKKSAHHAQGEGAARAEASRQRILARLDREIEEKERPAKEKLKAEMAGLKEKLTVRKEERVKKSKGSVDEGSDYVEYAVSKGVDAGGNNEANLDRIFEAYEEANTVNDFVQFMLKHSDLALTKERAESDPSIKQYLESKFDEEKTGLRYEDLVHALPAEEDYENNAHGQEVEEAEKTKKTKKIPSRLPPIQEFGVTEEKPSVGVSVGELRKKLKKSAKEKEPTQDVKDDLAALKNFPSTEVEEDLAFAKNLRESGVGELEETPKVKEEISAPEDIKPVKKETNKNVISRAAHEAEKMKIAREKLVEASRQSAAKTPELSSQAIEVIKRSAEEEEAKSARENQRFAPRPEDKEKADIASQAAAENKQWHEDKLELLSKSLIQAYKEIGVKITKDNKEDFLVKKPPFSYIFSAKGRKVRDLYSRYVKEL